MRNWPGPGAALLAAALLAPCPLGAQTAPASAAEAQLRFDLPAAPLDRTLAAFARQSRVSIIYDKRIVAQLRSAALRGQFTPQAALERLLAGTGQTASFIGPRSAIVHRIGEAPAVAAARRQKLPLMELTLAEVRAAAPIRIGTPPARDSIAYVRRAQAEIRRALAADPAYRGQPLHLRIGIVADPRGRITAISFDRRSGDPARDRRLPALLVGRELGEAPPEGLTQPLWFDIDVDRLDPRPQGATP